MTARYCIVYRDIMVETVLHNIVSLGYSMWGEKRNILKYSKENFAN